MRLRRLRPARSLIIIVTLSCKSHFCQADEPSLSHCVVSLNCVELRNYFALLPPVGTKVRVGNNERTLLQFLLLCGAVTPLKSSFPPRSRPPETGRLLQETTGVTVSLRFVCTLMHPHAPLKKLFTPKQSLQLLFF